MEPPSAHDAEIEAGKRLVEQHRNTSPWADRSLLSKEAEKEVVLRCLLLLWKVRLRPELGFRNCGYEHFHLWLNGIYLANFAAGLTSPPRVWSGVHWRRGYQPDYGPLGTFLREQGFLEPQVIDARLSIEIEIYETWLKIRNDDHLWNRETLHQTLCRFPGVSREYPFDTSTGVYTVGGKSFAIVAEDAEPPKVTLKCEPKRAEKLRQTYTCVATCHYRNKRYGNTVTLDGSVEITEVWEWMQHSYNLVFASLTRAQREQIIKAPTQ